MSDSSPSETPASRPPVRRWSSLLAIVISLVVIVGVIVRLTIKDRYRFPAVIFYMMSPASITGLCAIGWLLFRRANRCVAAKRMLLALFVAAGWTAATMYYTHPQQDRTDSTVRVMFWNVFRGHFGWDSIVDSIQDENPDVIVLAEVAAYRLPTDFWNKNFPNHVHVAKLPREVIVLSKHPITDQLEYHKSWKGLYQRLQLDIHRQKVELLIADIPSPPAYKRDQPIGLLTDLATQYADRPTIIVGDFNTPVDSIFLNAIRHQYRHAYEVGGNGYLATWPMPAPVIAIDHCWVSKHVDVTACRIKWTLSSDHRPIVTDLAIPPNAAAPSSTLGN